MRAGHIPGAIISGSMEIVVPDEYKHLYVQSKERPVVKFPAPILRQTARHVQKVSPKTKRVADEMARVMRMANGIGLAAPQIGIGERIIVIAPKGTRAVALINPRIVEQDGEMVGEEGCLSIPGLYGDVSRKARVVVEALDIRGRATRLDLEGLSSRVAQHEIDHLDGVLFTDKVDQSTLHWKNPEVDDEVE